MNEFHLPDGLNVRPGKPSDKPFLEKLYHSTRQDLQSIGQDKDWVNSLIDMQYLAQTQGYAEKFPNAMYFIIEKNGESIGKATVDFGCNEIRLVDIAFLPPARGLGFGRAVIQSFQMASAKVCAPMTLSVECVNRNAKNLYLSLGFQVESVSPPYEFMIWHPPSLKAMVGV